MVKLTLAGGSPPASEVWLASSFSVGAACVALGTLFRGITSQTTWLPRMMAWAVFFAAVWKAVDWATMAIELRRRRRCDQAAWAAGEEKVYASAKLIDVRPSRTLCVLHHPGSKAKKGLVFFVHGSMARLSQYTAQISHFRSAGFEVVAYDYYGCGRSPKPATGAYTTAAHLADLVAIFTRFANRPDGRRLPVLLVGHSFGCHQVLRLLENALTSGNELDLRVCLLGAGTPSAGRAKTMRRLFSLPLFALRLLHPVLSAGFRKRALHASTVAAESAPPGTRNEAHAQLLHLADATSGSNPMHVVQPFYTTLSFITRAQARRVAALAAAAGVPIVAVNGVADKLTTVAAARELVEAWLDGADTSFRAVDGASHQVMQEQPDIVNEVLLQLLQRGRREKRSSGGAGGVTKSPAP